MVASRLAEADRDLSILVIEQGPDNYGMPEVVHPALYPRNLFPTSKITLFWHTKKSPQLADRTPIVPSGGTLGGGSAMNWMGELSRLVRVDIGMAADTLVSSSGAVTLSMGT